MSHRKIGLFDALRKEFEYADFVMNFWSKWSQIFLTTGSALKMN